MPRPDVKVRMAQDSESEIVEGLVSEILDFNDWSPNFDIVFPYWLVAEIAGEIVGTINLRVALPISSIELLSVDTRLTKVQRASVVMMLVDSAIACCAGAGASGFSTMIPDGMESYQQVLEDKGMLMGNHGAILFGRIR